ncbi:hypothetical protein TPL01_12160 [Sulfuriferula plumbiphila]|uniref:Uncharacterized protein n=1 Tax=Sulfuriferula plumbiphila TaxID=171865 RepID=A0A512L6H3_9PROT|nr:hypothetical protein SFPGR_22270 [Sulfuriferula plumbiphila]GEP30078.1 hypothetical protein TPL01_12160 [Sulfuriferula plumbiphila]
MGERPEGIRHTPITTPWSPFAAVSASNPNQPLSKCRKSPRRTNSPAAGQSALTAPKFTPAPAAHSALPYKHAVRLEAQLKAEVPELFALAEVADQTAADASHERSG